MFCNPSVDTFLDSGSDSFLRFLTGNLANYVVFDENATEFFEIPVGMLLVKVFFGLGTRKVETISIRDVTAVWPPDHDATMDVSSVARNKLRSSDKVERGLGGSGRSGTGVGTSTGASAG